MILANTFFSTTATGVSILSGLLGLFGLFWRVSRSVSRTLAKIEENTRDMGRIGDDMREVKSRLIATDPTEAREMRHALASTLDRIERQVTTINDRTLAQLTDDNETRRIEKISERDRTSEEMSHIEAVPPRPNDSPSSAD